MKKATLFVWAALVAVSVHSAGLQSGKALFDPL